MSDIAQDDGKWIKRWVSVHCPDCNTGVDLPPGTLSEDGETEYRQCEDGHTIETGALYRALPGEATEWIEGL